MSELTEVRAVMVWPPRRRLLAESLCAAALVGVLYLVLVALSVWGTYGGQRGRVDIETGEPVPFDFGAAWAEAFEGFPRDLAWPGLWLVGTVACLVLLSGQFALRAGARILVAGFVALVVSAPLTFGMFRYMVVSDGWGGGPAGLGLLMLLATPVIGAGVWAMAIGLRSVPLFVARLRTLGKWVDQES